MGKLINLILILILVDMLFLLTAQFALDSPSSVILSAVINPEDIKSGGLWRTLLTGAGGVSALIAVGGVIAGLLTRNSDITIFAAMASALALLVGDYISIMVYLRSVNAVLAWILMAPIIVVFAMTIVEWLRNKD